jgi:cardiolipin synthase (CMP-forming)
MTLPNWITLLRLFLVPMTVVAIANGAWLTAFLVFVLAGVSDAVDGALARHFNLESELGKHLDPAADKALLVSIYITLAAVGVMPLWLAALVVSRDIMIVMGFLLATILGRPMTIRPLFISKINTAAQIALAALVLFEKTFHWPPAMVTPVAYLFVAAFTLASTLAYVLVWQRHLMPDGEA